MYGSAPHFRVVQAPVEVRSGARISAFEEAELQHELFIHNDNSSYGAEKLTLTRATSVALALLALTVATVFLVLQCFRALTLGTSMNIHRVTARRLAEGGETSCSVGHHLERTAHAAALHCVPNFVGGGWRLNLEWSLGVDPTFFCGRYRLNLGYFLRASRGVGEGPEQKVSLVTQPREVLCCEKSNAPTTSTSMAGACGWRSCAAVLWSFCAFHSVGCVRNPIAGGTRYGSY